MTEIILSVLVYIFVGVSTLMIFRYIANLCLTAKYFKSSKINRETINDNSGGKVSMLIMLPCLREQNVITASIDYFSKMSLENIDLYIGVACTHREELTNAKYGFTRTTASIAREYIVNTLFPDNVKVFVYEADDLENGDRATQMNFAVDSFVTDHPNIKLDIVAAFDADSRPTPKTFEEVARKYRKNPHVSYQQPDVYIASASDMKDDGSSLLAMANAVYQNSWTMISEIPMLIRYGRKKGKFSGYFYCNGHGEFFPYEVFKKYRFPEYEITDGIHIGYRLGMSGAEVEILDNYGNTDAPHTVKALPKQHKRWYGGCMRLFSCYKWCKANGFKPKKTMVAFGLWSQFRWVFTAPLYCINFILSILIATLFHNFMPMVIMGTLLVVYCYLFGAISLMLTPERRKFHFGAFLIVPFAIFLKSIGPNIYIFEQLFKKKIVYEKVER